MYSIAFLSVNVCFMHTSNSNLHNPIRVESPLEMELFVVNGRPESSLSDDVVTPFNSKLFPLFNWCCECDMAGGDISMAACLTKRWWFDGNVVLIELLLALPTALTVFITFEPYSVDNNGSSWLFNFAIAVDWSSVLLWTGPLLPLFLICVSLLLIISRSVAHSRRSFYLSVYFVFLLFIIPLYGCSTFPLYLLPLLAFMHKSTPITLFTVSSHGFNDAYAVMNRTNVRRVLDDNDDAECTKRLHESTLIIVHTRHRTNERMETNEGKQKERNESDTIQKPRMVSLSLYVLCCTGVYVLYEYLHVTILVSVNEWVDIDSIWRCMWWKWRCMCLRIGQNVNEKLERKCEREKKMNLLFHADN